MSDRVARGLVLDDRHTHFFRLSNDALIIADAELRIVDANERAVAMYGWTLDELRTMTVFDLRTPESLHSLDADLAGARDGAVYETTHRRRDGSRVEVEVSSRCVEIGGRICFASIVRDVGERNRALRQLRYLNRAHRLLGGVGAATVRVRTRQALFEETCAIAVDAGRFCLAWIGVVDEHDERVRVAAARGSALSYLDGIVVTRGDDAGGRGPTGTAIREGRIDINQDFGADARMTPWRERALAAGIRSSAAFPLFAGGRVFGALTLYAGEAGFFGTEEQSTIAQVAEVVSFAANALEREERQRILSHVIDQSASIVVVTSTEGIIEYVNPRFTEVTGWKPEEALGKRPNILASGKTPPAAYEELWATLREGKTWHGEFGNKTKDGKPFLARATISPMLGEDGQIAHFVATEEDVTDRRRLELELQEAQKLESLSLLAGGVAHDFNNLITCISSYADLLASELSNRDQARSDVEEIRRASERATALTRQLLAFSRRQPIAPVVVDVNQVAAGLFSMLRRLIGENYEISFVLGDPPPIVRADPGQLEQVIVNLVVNARDAMPNGGVVRLETRVDESSAASPRALLVVSDSGVGMDEDTIAHIFEPFFTTKALGHGTGLGLSTCFGIAKQCGGAIRVTSRPGHGASFEVELPALIDETPSAAPPPPVTSSAARPISGTVLLAEDDPALLALATRAMRALGLDALPAANGEEALRIFRSRADVVTLLVTDVVMPRLGGPELARAARAIRPNLPVLFVSGYLDAQTFRGLHVDPMNLLSKPFTAGVLIERVRALLRLGA